MHRYRIQLAAAAALVALTALPAPRALATSGAPSARPVTEKDFSVQRFSARSTTVDNTFLPLRPGRQFTLTGTTTAGTHEVVFTVTNVTKWVDHVRTVVLWDRDFQDGVLAEEELAFWAQDDSGNVWLLGEYPEEIDATTGARSAPRTWLAGHQGATAGVLMRANPQTNTSAYLQGLAPAVQFIDEARVAQTNQTVCVPTGCYSGVLVVDEWNPQNQPADGHQFKYHAPGVGVVQIVGKGGTEQETLVLTRDRILNPAEMQQATVRTLELDLHGYGVAPAVYRHTAFATVRPH
ncbi:MAG TPA: hypothetical protein VJ622_09775 [Acidimicrobiia bacterium]|nr:hypothetical protein [Acidimicrobiia bacterium]